jgi:xanthosine utilization system XapX-like protein
MDAIIPEGIADDEMRERVGNVTGAFVGGNLGGNLGYALSGQRELDLSPTGLMRGAAGMTPSGTYDRPAELPLPGGFRRKSASAWPLAGWLAPVAAGIAGGSYLGGHAAPWIQQIMPDGTPLDAAVDMGHIGGGVLGAEAGSLAGRGIADKIRAYEAERRLGAGLDNPNIPGVQQAVAKLAGTDDPGFLQTIGPFGKWLGGSMLGILGGATIGDAAAPLLAGLTPEGTYEAGQHVGRMAGGLLGGTVASGLTYTKDQPAAAPDFNPVGITSIAAGVPVDPDKPAVDLLAGTNKELPAKVAAPQDDDSNYIVSPNEHAVMQGFRDAGNRWGSGTDPRQALHEYAQLGSAGTRIRIGPVGVRHFSRMFSMLPGNPSWDDSMERHYDEFQRGPMSGYLIRQHEFENEFKWKHKEGDHSSLENVLSAVKKHGLNVTPEQAIAETKGYLPKEWNAHPAAISSYGAGYRQMLDDIKPHLTDGAKVEVNPDFSGRLRRAAEQFSADTYGKNINQLAPAEQAELHDAFNAHLKVKNPRLFAEKQIADFFVGLDVPRSGNTYALVAKPMNMVGDMFGRQAPDHIEQRPIKSLVPNAQAFLSPEGAAIGAGVGGLALGGTLLAHTLMGGGGDASVAQPQVA